MPHTDEHIPEVLQLTQEQISSLRKQAKPNEVRITMPMLDLKTRLEGIEEFFPAQICNARLKVIQESRIKVGPIRTTAASATAAISYRSNQVEVINANRPFKFVLQVEEQVLFDGVVSDSKALIPLPNKKEYLEKTLKNFKYEQGDAFTILGNGYKPEFTCHLLNAANLEASQLEKSFKGGSITEDEALQKLQLIINRVNKKSIGIIDSENKLFQNLLAYNGLLIEVSHLRVILKDIKGTKKEEELQIHLNAREDLKKFTPDVKKIISSAEDLCQKIFPLDTAGRPVKEEGKKFINLDICYDLQKLNVFRKTLRNSMELLTLPSKPEEQEAIESSYRDLKNKSERLIQRVHEKKYGLKFLHLASFLLESINFMSNPHPLRINGYDAAIARVNNMLTKAEENFEKLKERVRYFEKLWRYFKEKLSDWEKKDDAVVCYEGEFKKLSKFIADDKLNDREVLENLEVINRNIGELENSSTKSYTTSGIQGLVKRHGIDFSKVKM